MDIENGSDAILDKIRQYWRESKYFFGYAVNTCTLAVKVHLCVLGPLSFFKAH